MYLMAKAWFLAQILPPSRTTLQQVNSNGKAISSTSLYQLSNCIHKEEEWACYTWKRNVEHYYFADLMRCADTQTPHLHNGYHSGTFNAEV
jgi:hypothetical protein